MELLVQVGAIARDKSTKLIEFCQCSQLDSRIHIPGLPLGRDALAAWAVEMSAGHFFMPFDPHNRDGLLKNPPDGEFFSKPLPGIEPGTSALRKHCSTS